ncbi:MAG: hypothetical protein WCI00_04195 [bacterium]
MPKSSTKPLGKKSVQAPVKKQAIKAHADPKIKLSKVQSPSKIQDDKNFVVKEKDVTTKVLKADELMGE